MKKTFFCIILIFAILCTTFRVFATEIPDIPEEVLSDDEFELTIMDDIDDIINAPLVDALTTASGMDEVQNSDDITYFTGNKIISDEIVNLKDTSINGNLVIFAQNIDLKNVTVNGDVAIFGQYISISDLNVINGVTVLAGQNIVLDMLFTEGNVYAAAQNVESNIVANDLFVMASNAVIENETEIRNIYNLEEIMPKGEVEIIVSPADIFRAKVFNVLRIVVKTAVVAGFIFLCISGFVQKTKSDNNVKYIGFSALKGFLWTIVIPVIAIIMMFTIFGIGIGFVLLALYIIIFWAAVPIISIVVMNMVAKDTDSNWKKYGITLCVSFALGIASQIPALGGVITALTAFASMGIVIGLLKPIKKEKTSDIVIKKEENNSEEN